MQKEHTLKMSLSEILNKIKGIAYYKEVMSDIEVGDFSWEVTRYVWEMALQYKKNPDLAKYIPPLKVDSNLNLVDGSHRISTIYLLSNYLDTRNPFWNKLEIPVRII